MSKLRGFYCSEKDCNHFATIGVASRKWYKVPTIITRSNCEQLFKNMSELTHTRIICGNCGTSKYNLRERA